MVLFHQVPSMLDRLVLSYIHLTSVINHQFHSFMTSYSPFVALSGFSGFFWIFWFIWFFVTSNHTWTRFSEMTVMSEAWCRSRRLWIHSAKRLGVPAVSSTWSLNCKNKIRLTSWPYSLEKLMQLAESAGPWALHWWQWKQTLINKSSATTIIISAKYASLLPTVRPPRICDQLSCYLWDSTSPALQLDTHSGESSICHWQMRQANTGIEISRTSF